ncbi:hypothetical protein GV64_21475 [Endozoicomonas elysicola]|uniref:Uncharacterized protein n=2 Tax=Endozoicomonas elysicola TaxID=305900 RepID=A0A081KFM1_9GAMM|nr:hypothetical protein GV64_21475 [Endozoicomonas elysicola]
MPGQRGTETSEQTFKPLGAREKKESIPFDDSDNQISELFSLINITSDPNHKDGNLLKPVAVYTRQHSAPEKVGGNCKDISESNPIHQDRVVSKTRKRQRLEMPEDTSQKFASFPKRHHLRPEMSYTATRDMRFIFTPQAPVTHSPQQMDSLPFDMKFFEERDMGSDRRNAEKTQLPEGKP